MSMREHDILRKLYPLHVQIGIIAALALLLLAFRLDWSPTSEFDIVIPDDEPITIEDIPQTDADQTPQPPPRPSVPVAVSDDSELPADDLDFGQEFENLMSDTPPLPPPTEDPIDTEPEPFWVVEEKPQPVGGMEAIYEHVKEYPEMARKAGIEGRVFVQLVVDEQGNVRDAEVVRGVGGGLDELALEAIEKTKFSPGKQRGKPVRVKMSLSIVFRLK